MLSVNELMNLQKTNFISGVEVIQWASFQIGKQSNCLTPHNRPPISAVALKKGSTLWYVPLKILWLFNYSVSCLMVILLEPATTMVHISEGQRNPDWSSGLASCITSTTAFHSLISESNLVPCGNSRVSFIFYSKHWRIYHILGYPFQTYVAFVVRTFAIWIFLIFHLSSPAVVKAQWGLFLASFMPCKTSGWDPGGPSVSYSDKHTTWSCSCSQLSEVDLVPNSLWYLTSLTSLQMPLVWRQKPVQQ